MTTTTERGRLAIHLRADAEGRLSAGGPLCYAKGAWCLLPELARVDTSRVVEVDETGAAIDSEPEQPDIKLPPSNPTSSPVARRNERRAAALRRATSTAQREAASRMQTDFFDP